MRAFCYGEVMELAGRAMTIAYPIREGRILLGMKKKKIGVGWWNGFGGGVEGGETQEQAARRELFEESGLRWIRGREVGVVSFVGTSMPGYAHVFLVNEFEGEPVETAEMSPCWFSVSDIPYEHMWPADRIWLPRVLAGFYVRGLFYYEGDNVFINHELEEVSLHE